MAAPPPRHPPPPRQPGRLGWIAAALAGASAAAAALIVFGPIETVPGPAPSDPSPTPTAPTDPPARSAAELNAALQGSSGTPKGSSGTPKGTDPAAGPIPWETLTKRCFEDVARNKPSEMLRLVDSTGFVPKATEAETRLGFAWDQAVRLSLQPVGGGAAVAIECFFQKGVLAGKGRG